MNAHTSESILASLMKEHSLFFQLDAVGEPGGEEWAGELASFRMEQIEKFGMLAPEMVYPVHVCPECGRTFFSAAVIAPEKELYSSFTSFIRETGTYFAGLPLLRCPCGEAAPPSDPDRTATFVFIPSRNCDLLLVSRGDRMESSWLVKPPRELERTPVCTEDDEEFLAATGTVFSLRWAWNRLLPAWYASASEIEGGGRLKRVTPAVTLAAIASEPGRPADERFEEYVADSLRGRQVVVLQLNKYFFETASRETPPLEWLGEWLEPLSNGRLALYCAVDEGWFLERLRRTLLDRGIRMRRADDGEWKMESKNIAVTFDPPAIIRNLALDGYNPEFALKAHVIGRMELLENMVSLADRLHAVCLEKGLRVSLEDESRLVVSNGEEEAPVDLVEHAEAATLDERGLLRHLAANVPRLSGLLGSGGEEE